MNSNQTTVKIIFDRWNGSINNFDTILESVTDEQLQEEIAPGKNRGIYILGHLVAVHDDMIRLLDFGEKLYPELYEPFIKSPDRSVSEIPSASELRTYWANMNKVLSQKCNNLQTDDWFGKHTAVSEEDFEKEPHRNKLNIILTRTTHLAYHTGQLILIKR